MQSSQQRIKHTARTCPCCQYNLDSRIYIDDEGAAYIVWHGIKNKPRRWYQPNNAKRKTLRTKRNAKARR